MSARLATDAAAVRGAVGDQLGLLVQNLVTMIAGFAVAFAYGWKMTLVVLSVVPLMGAAGYFQVHLLPLSLCSRCTCEQRTLLSCIGQRAEGYHNAVRSPLDLKACTLKGYSHVCRQCSWWASARTPTSCLPAPTRRLLRRLTTSERCVLTKQHHAIPAHATCTVSSVHAAWLPQPLPRICHPPSGHLVLHDAAAAT
jgi:ABC transporter transmembrane region